MIKGGLLSLPIKGGLLGLLDRGFALHNQRRFQLRKLIKGKVTLVRKDAYELLESVKFVHLIESFG
jgi:hypothetical protein